MNVGDTVRLTEGPGPWGKGVVVAIVGDGIKIDFRGHIWVAARNRVALAPDTEPDIFPSVIVDIEDL